MSARARAPRIRHRWERLDDAALLRVRFRDLGLKFVDSPVHADALRLGEALERRGIRFKPHFWFSTDWFSPDGVPGIAVPFFLGHPRLLRLERRMMGEAEGSNRPWRLRLLRHELGHAVDTAFGLRRRRDWQQVFGPAGARYSARLHRATQQQGPRAAPRALVCTEPSDRRLRRDLRRLASTEGTLARGIRRLAGARQARIRR